MSVPNRSELINNAYKVLRKHYEPVQPPADRSVLEHLLYACCLENAPPVAADEAFARLQQTFFDWNEVRVTTVAELAETVSSLPDAPAAATRLKHALQHVFEKHYAFDLEALRKQNLGKSVSDLEGIRGVTPFVVAYVTQHALGGHAIPTSLGIIAALEVLGVISEAEAKKHRAPGLERAVPKAKGMEFASVLQQFGADFYVAPSGDKVKAVVSEVDPAALDRLPQHSLHEEAATRRAEHALNAVPPGDKGRGTPEQPLVATSASDAGPPATAPKRRRRKSEAAEADQAADAEAPADAAGEEPNPASPPGSSPTKQLIRKKPR